MRNATTTLAPPTADATLEDFGALYPLGSLWGVDEADEGAGRSGGLDEEELDEAIFAGMVALR